MANQTITTDSNILTVTAGLNNGQNITVNNEAILTFDVSPDKLIGQSDINDGKYLLDGANAVNPIIFCGDVSQEINVNGAGTLETTLGWWEFPTLGTGLANQTFDCSTYYSSDPNNNITADVFSGVWIETGRRIDYDNGSGIAPVVYDWCFKTDGTLLGRIANVSGDGITGFIVLEFMFGSLADNDAIELHTIQDNLGSDYQKSWNALVNNASGDVFHADVFSRWGNLTQNNINNLGNVFDGFEGMGFAQSYGSNTLTFGDGVNGLVVPNGARIRVPMVHFCTSNTTQYALGNTVMAGESETTRHNIETALGGDVILRGVSLGSVFFNDSNANSFLASYVAFNVGFGVQSCGSKVLMDNIIGVADLTATNSTNTKYVLNTVDLINGCQIDDISLFWMHSGGAERGLSGGSTSFDINYKRLIQIGELNDFEVNKVKGGSIHDVVIIGNVMRFSTATNLDITLLKSQLRFDGSNNSITGGVTLTTFSDGITLVGWEVLKGSGTDTANLSITDSSNIKVRGFHFMDDPYIKSLPEEEFINCNGLTADVDVARCFTGGQSNPNEFIQTTTTSKNITVTDCSGDYSGEIQPQGTNVIFNGVAGGVGNLGSGTGQETDLISSFGGNVASYYRSETTGAIGVNFMPESIENPITDIVGNPKFTRNGDFDVKSGDSFIIHSYRKMNGHNSFTGVFTTSRQGGSVSDGTDEWGGNPNIDFQYDTRAGFNGTWLDLRRPANLTSITGMVSGIEMKFRITATATETNLNGIMIGTLSTIADRKANFHAIDQIKYTLTLTGLQIGTDIVILSAGTDTVLASVDQTTDTTFIYTYQTLDPFDIGIIKQGFVTQYIYGITPVASDSSLPIKQVTDRNYLT